MDGAPSALPVRRLAEPGKVTQMRVARSEWTELHSLRSTRWSLLVAVVLMIGFPLLFATILASRQKVTNPHRPAPRASS